MAQYPNDEQTNLKKMNTALIVALTAAVVALIIVMVALLIGNKNKTSRTTSGPRVVADDEAANSAWETEAVPEETTVILPETTLPMTEITAPPTVPVATAPPTTAAPTPVGGVGYPGIYRVSYATPAHAGVVVRQGPSSSTTKLGVLSEGTLVEYDSLVPPQNGYAKICWVDNGHLSYGWVMTAYLIYHSDAAFSGNWGSETPTSAPTTAGKSSGGGMGHEGYPYVSYNTPAHAGVVVRSGPSSSSENLGVIPEGTAVKSSGRRLNGYSEVVVDPYGQGYRGWIMTDYITYQ